MMNKYLNFISLLILTILSFGYNANADHVEPTVELVDGVNIVYAPSLTVQSITSFDYAIPLNTNNDIKITYSWSLVNILSVDYLHSLVRLEGPIQFLKGNGWVSVGFGKSIFDIETPICFQNGTTEPVFIEEYFNIDKKYEAALTKTQTATEIIGGFSTNEILVCEYRRPLSPNDNIHINLSANDKTNFLYAYSSGNDVKNTGVLAASYGKNEKGRFTAVLSTGNYKFKSNIKFSVLLAHGIIMLVAFLILIPISSLVNSEFKNTNWWKSYYSTILDLINFIFVIVAFVLVLTQWIDFSTSHSRLGMATIIMYFLYVCASIFWRVYNTLFDTYHFQVVIAKKGLLIITWICAIASSALGLNILFPWSTYSHYPHKSSGRASWTVYILFTCLCFLSFIGYQSYKYLFANREGSSNYMSFTDKILRKTTKTKIKHTAEIHEISSPKSKDTLAAISKTGLPEATTMTLYKEDDKKEILKFTWESLEEAVRNGGKFVVANGKYVFSISRWINQHPGGQLILQVVNGTDITNDYFHEAGFDADDIVPKVDLPDTFSKAFPQASTNTLQLNKVRQSYQSYGQASSTHSRRETDVIVSDNKYISTLSEGDWKMIIKSRKPHVHSKSAMEKLSSFFIGTLATPPYKGFGVPPAESLLPSGYTDANFSPHEYRRYALLATQEIADSVLELRFSLLYPHDRRIREPINFLPGQVIQFQARINNSEITASYYPVLDGNMQHFKILANLTEGAANGYFMQQNLGQRQHKFRGPYGTPLFKIPKDPYERPTFPRDIVVFSSGLGVLCADQILRYIFLPSFEAITAIEEYSTDMEDELNISTGDRIIILHHYYDGWAFACNLRTNQEGLVPLTVFPVLNPIKVTLVHIGTGFEHVEKTIAGIKVLQDENVEIEIIKVDKVTQVGELFKSRCVQLIGTDGTFVKLLSVHEVDNLNEDEEYNQLQVVVSSDNMVDELSLLKYMKDFGVSIPSKHDNDASSTSSVTSPTTTLPNTAANNLTSAAFGFDPGYTQNHNTGTWKRRKSNIFGSDAPNNNNNNNTEHNEITNSNANPMPEINNNVIANSYTNPIHEKARVTRVFRARTGLIQKYDILRWYNP